MWQNFIVSAKKTFSKAFGEKLLTLHSHKSFKYPFTIAILVPVKPGGLGILLKTTTKRHLKASS